MVEVKADSIIIRFYTMKETFNLALCQNKEPEYVGFRLLAVVDKVLTSVRTLAEEGRIVLGLGSFCFVCVHPA